MKKGKFVPNTCTILGDDCWISLYNKKGELKGLAIVDAEDYDKVVGYHWCEKSNGAIQRSDGRFLSHIILDFYFVDYDELVDHANRMKWDNRKKNLRICNHSQNLSNQKIRSDNTSGYKGVSWDKERMKWETRISTQGRSKFLGRYLTKEEAAQAYNEAALKYYGEFALLNKIGE